MAGSRCLDIDSVDKCAQLGVRWLSLCQPGPVPIFLKNSQPSPSYTQGGTTLVVVEEVNLSSPNSSRSIHDRRITVGPTPETWSGAGSSLTLVLNSDWQLHLPHCTSACFSQRS